MKLFKDNRGIAHMALILLLLLLVLAASGFFAYRSYQMRQQQKASQSSESAEAEIVQPSQDQYLEVPEYGVKFKLTADIADAYYDVNTDSTDSMNLRVHALDNDPDCKNSNLSVAGLIRVGKDEINPQTDQKFVEGTPGKVVGDKFYYIGLAQYYCAADTTEGSASQVLMEKIRKAFSAASATITSL